MKQDTPVATAKPNFIRRLYDWILGWADSRWGEAALFILAFVESSFFPIPPDVLLIALCLGCPRRSFRYAAICLGGSLCGAAVAYALGFWAWNAVDHWFIPAIFSEEAFRSVGDLYNEWNFWIHAECTGVINYYCTSFYSRWSKCFTCSTASKKSNIHIFKRIMSCFFYCIFFAHELNFFTSRTMRC